MKEKNLFTLQTLIICLLLNGALVAVYFFMATYVFQGIEQRIGLLTAEGAKALPPDALGALGDLQAFVRQMNGYLLPALFGLCGLTTLILWLLIQFPARIAIRRASQAGKPAVRPEGEKKEPKKEKPLQPSPAPAVQLLSILQRQGRFIDFLEEDLKLYDDAQIGAAVRSIHDGCKQALSEHVGLSPVIEQEEGSDVTIQPGFDAYAVRLTGNVSGEPPFRGALRHRGWRVVKIELPQQVEGQEKKWIVAPAEVEVP